MNKRMFRSVLAVVLTLSLALQGMVGFAATSGEELYKHGFISGGSSTEMILHEDKVFTREQLAKIVCEVMGVEREAAAYKGEMTFSDAEDVSDWAKPYVAYVEEKKLMVGDAGKFIPQGNVSERELGAVMLRAMGYDYAWEKVPAALLFKGIAAMRQNLTRGQAFDYIWRAVTLPIDISGKSLAEKLGKIQPEQIEQSVSEVTVQAARNFRLEVLADGVKLLTDANNKQFLLVADGKAVPGGFEGVPVIKTPVKRVLACTTPVVSYVRELGAAPLTSIVGVTTKKEEWVFSEIVSGMESGSIKYIDKPWGAPINAEEVVALKPDVVFVDGSDFENDAKLAEQLAAFGIPVLFVQEYTEPYENGLVEWIKFFGAFYNADADAKRYFDAAVAKQSAVFEKAKALPAEQRVSVAMGMGFGGTFYVKGKDTVVSQTFDRLGGNYVFGELDGGSLQLTLEEYVAKAKDADVLIYDSLPQYLGGVEGLVAAVPQIKEFKAYRNNKIYILDQGFYMNKARTAEKLADLLFILHPELAPNHSLQFYQLLDVTK